MADRPVLAAEARTLGRKAVLTALRREGKVPAVVYGHGDPAPIALDSRELNDYLRHHGPTGLLDLQPGLGEHRGDGPELRKRLPELLPAGRVPDGFVQGSLGQSDRSTSDRHPERGEGGEHERESTAAFADAGFDGIHYLLRHDPSQRLAGVALFGPAGAPPWPFTPGDPIGLALIEEAERRFGLRVMPAP